MEKDLSQHRKFYNKHQLSEKDLPANPLALFKKWFEEVEQAEGLEEANAMTVSTLETDGFPRGRVVLLKYFNETGFTFFTNYASQKGKAIIKNPEVCLSFFWPNLERQVIIKGLAEKTTEKQSDTYFNSRPRLSRLGALVSNQSEPVKERTVLEEKLKDLELKYKGKDIPRPKHWGGFTVKPIEIEFWQGRESRLHDRIRFRLEKKNNWTIDRLQP